MDAAALGNDAEAFVEALLVSLSSRSDNIIEGLAKSAGEGVTSQAVLSLNKAKDLLNASVRIVGQKLTKQFKDEVTDDAKAGGNGEVFLKMMDISFFEPRGKFTASFSSSGLLLEGKTANCFVPWEHVSHVSAFPSNITTKKEGEDMLAMRLSAGQVKFAGKDLSGILLSLSKCLGTPIRATSPECADTPLEGIAAIVVPKLIQLLWKKAVVTPRKDLFQSIGVGPGGATKPYLRCHKGVQEGAIYPLSNGVVFVKPLLFIPAEEIASLTAGRGGGSGQTRYVDLKIETSDDKEYEFVNIEREELPALQNYVKGYLEARAKEEAEKKRLNGESGDAQDDDSDDEDDDDFDPDASDSNDDDDDSDASGDSDGDDDDDSNVSDEESVHASRTKARQGGEKKRKSPTKVESEKKKMKSSKLPSPIKADAERVVENESKDAAADVQKENIKAECAIPDEANDKYSPLKLPNLSCDQQD